MEELISQCRRHDGAWMQRKRVLDTFTVFNLIAAAITSSGLRPAIAALSFNGGPCFSVSALVVARRKIDWGFFRRLLVHLYTFFSQTLGKKFRWKGLRIFAIDGTKINLPRELVAKKYRRPSKQAYYPQGLLSVLYDVLTGLPFHGILCRHENERAAAKQHLDQLGKEDLILYDRGYLSGELLQKHQARGINLIARLSESSFKELQQIWRSPSRDIEVTIERKDFKVQLRVIKYQVNGSIFALVTTLLDRQQYPLSALQDLYHQRWQVEEGIKFFKHEYEFEHFHSQTPQGVKQEIFITLILTFLTRLLELSRKPLKLKKQQRRKPSATCCKQLLQNYLQSTCWLEGIVDFEKLALMFKIRAKNLSNYLLGRAFPRISHKPAGKWKLSDKKRKKRLRLLATSGVPP